VEIDLSLLHKDLKINNLPITGVNTYDDSSINIWASRILTPEEKDIITQAYPHLVFNLMVESEF